MSPALRRALSARNSSSHGNRVIDRDAGHLRGGVHAGIGAAGGVERMVRADDRGDFVFDDRLDGLRVRLPLPAGVGGAVVGDRQLEGAWRHCIISATRTRLDDRNTLLAERTRVGLIGLHVHRQQRVKRHVESLLAAAAIDHRARADHDRARRARHVHRLARRAAGGDDVFDDQHLLAGVEREAAAQRQRAVLPFREDGADPKGASYFLADHDAAERRRQHRDRAERSNERAQRCAQRLGVAADAAARARIAGSRGCASPDESRKWPSSSAPDCRNMVKTSDSVIER